MIEHTYEHPHEIRITATVTLCCNDDRIRLEPGDEIRLESWRPEGFITPDGISKNGIHYHGLLWARDLDKVEPVIPLKTLDMWKRNHCPLSNFLKPGDEITDDLRMALYDKYHAVTSNDDAIQLGDATQLTAQELEELRFHSFLECSNTWRYLGQCRKFPQSLARHYFVTDLNQPGENQTILRSVLNHFHLVINSVAGQETEWYFADADGTRHRELPAQSFIHYIHDNGFEISINLTK